LDTPCFYNQSLPNNCGGNSYFHRDCNTSVYGLNAVCEANNTCSCEPFPLSFYDTNANTTECFGPYLFESGCADQRLYERPCNDTNIYRCEAGICVCTMVPPTCEQDSRECGFFNLTDPCRGNEILACNKTCAVQGSLCNTTTNQCYLPPQCTLDIDCDDGVSQTIDTCVNASCTHTIYCAPDACHAPGIYNYSTNRCDPGAALPCGNSSNLCQTASCDPIVGCVIEPITCADNSNCTIDSCNPSVGCVYSPVASYGEYSLGGITTCYEQINCTTQADCAYIRNITNNACLIPDCVTGICAASSQLLCIGGYCNPLTSTCVGGANPCVNNLLLCEEGGVYDPNNNCTCSYANCTTDGFYRNASGICVPCFNDPTQPCLRHSWNATSKTCEVNDLSQFCDVGDPCMSNTCNFTTGACISQEKGYCFDLNACTTDSCSSNTSQCIFSPVANCSTGGCNCGDLNTLDPNPCNYYYCDTTFGNGTECNRAHIVGCCYTDSDCGNGTDYCNTLTNTCAEFRLSPPPSCTDNDDCYQLRPCEQGGTCLPSGTCAYAACSEDGFSCTYTACGTCNVPNHENCPRKSGYNAGSCQPNVCPGSVTGCAYYTSWTNAFNIVGPVCCVTNDDCRSGYTCNGQICV
jgi:hypothetical protein